MCSLPSGRAVIRNRLCPWSRSGIYIFGRIIWLYFIWGTRIKYSVHLPDTVRPPLQRRQGQSAKRAYKTHDEGLWELMPWESFHTGMCRIRLILTVVTTFMDMEKLSQTAGILTTTMGIENTMNSSVLGGVVIKEWPIFCNIPNTVFFSFIFLPSFL